MQSVPWNEALLFGQENILIQLVPSAHEWEPVIHVSRHATPFRLAANPREQRAICWQPPADNRFS